MPPWIASQANENRLVEAFFLGPRYQVPCTQVFGLGVAESCSGCGLDKKTMFQSRETGKGLAFCCSATRMCSARSVLRPRRTASENTEMAEHLEHGPLAGPTSRIYFSQRLRLHYVDWGNPEAPPLLLVHGGRDHCRNWDWIAQRLSNG